jgi:chromosomal replication initiator protein
VQTPRSAPAVKTTATSDTTNRRDTQLTDFIVGASNEYAFRAADLAARARQQASPVLFCGPTGVGKTHLLRAIVRDFRRHQPRGSAVYLSAEQFTTSFVEAVCGRGLPSFRQKCRGSNLLAIDDLQFIAGKQRTSEELLHTIDTLAADGKQLVLASDRPLADLRSLGPELVSRLAGGLICEIEPPEFATRLEIVRRLAREVGLALTDDVCKLVATQVTSSPRELRGAVNRLQAMALSYERPISREQAEQALADLARHNTRSVRLADVQKAVCDVFGVEPAALRSDRKGRSVSEPRMIGMWLARKYTRAAWSEIGEFFGRKSHSTVISAHKRVERLISDQARVGMSSGACSVEDAIRRLEAALRTA